jgi:hypothetical protein
VAIAVAVAVAVAGVALFFPPVSLHPSTNFPSNNKTTTTSAGHLPTTADGKLITGKVRQLGEGGSVGRSLVIH